MLRTLALAALAAAWSAAALAQPKPDPEWPCPQRKVPTLGFGAVWTGPDPTQALQDWGRDREAAQLAQKLASRKTPLDEVDPLLAEFVEKAGPDKAERLTRVFAGVFDVINGERGKVVAGIGRYARGQRVMAERIRDEAGQISEIKTSPDVKETKELSELETRFNWDKRIFQERSQSLTYVCEVPTLLEQRLGEIARKIQAKL
ncbi:conserved hypothetical protein [Methylobacterium sp. 4-46]|uniref:hypothetical protein n=1 Tax=unclassified Methylobacterium TaxID=2615210 RepID=UPI000152E449|nr:MULTISPECIES: hypothetical protein [Methylobacterium]ACA19334.1 conserved hypothetical protein [Methylobacterium sp. 4-46]WFT83655.1 hypothetical protein QA634_25170 [Methylobacterium nodulans]